MIIVYISALISITIIVLIWVLIRSRYLPPKPKEAKAVPKRIYTKKFFLPNKSIGIYSFLETCFDRFTLVPDKVYRYKESYYALWRHYGSGAITGHDKYARVLIIRTDEKKLYGHIRCPRVLESKKHFIHIKNNYYQCGFDSCKLYINERYLSELSKATSNHSDSGWNFVFADGWLAIYYNGFSFNEDKLAYLYDSFNPKTIEKTAYGSKRTKDLSD